MIGTIFPQTQATFSLPSIASMKPELAKLFDSSIPKPNLESFFEGLVIIVGTVTTMIYFQFGVRSKSGEAKPGRVTKILNWIGQFFIAVTFGVLFAGVLAASMTALIERWSSIVIFLRSLF